MNRFKLFLISVAAGAALLANAAGLEVNVSVTPKSVAAGELVHYTLTTNLPGLRNLAFPRLENGRWLTNSISQSTRIVNGVGSYSYTIPIQPQREGTLTIPAFEVQIGNQTAQTQPVEIKVLSPGEQPALPESSGESLSMKEALFGRILLPEKRDFYYVGEEIPLTLELFAIPQLRMELMEYPELSGLGNAVFHDYSDENQQNRKFARIRTTRTTLQDRPYHEAIFSTAFRATAPGKLKPEATVTVGIQPPSEQRQRRRPQSIFDDDFFDFFGGGPRKTPYKVVFASPGEIAVRALPPAPAGVLNLGLLGRWELECRFDQASGMVGEPLTLNLTLSGDGSPETLAVPKLTLPGFRVYPGEVKKQSAGITNHITIRYALIPLEPGVRKQQLKFATFDPATGEYAVREFNLEIPVAKSDRPATAAVSSGAALPPEPDAVAEPEVPAPAPVREEIFYQKPGPGVAVQLPLIRNQLWFILLCVIGGPVTGLLLELRHRRRMRAANDPEYLRRRELRDRLPQLLRRLRSVNGSELERVLREEAVPFLAEALKLPHGATAGEVAEHLDDSELRQLFRNTEFASFRPDAAAASFPPGTVEKLCKLLKRVGVFALLGAFFLLHGAEADFNAAFDKGEFKQAVEDYRKQLNPQAPSPALLYNIGSSYYRMNDLPRALYCFEQAHLLAPRDSETLENLNLVNRKLALPEIGRTNSPGALLLWCRDRLRPDQYWAIAAAVFALMCIGLGLRHSFRPSTVLTYEAVAALVLVLAITAAVSQANGPYNPDRGIVNGNSLELRTLPAAASGRIEATVPGGSAATVVERRGDWLRVKVNGRDGWAPAGRINIIFPGGVF